MKNIVLASQSPYRKQLLARLGVDFVTTHPLFDEDESDIKSQIADPEKLVSELAGLKAKSVARLFNDSLIIGSDQLVSFEGKILGKPHTFDKALEQLQSMRGKSHQLLTAVSLIEAENLISFVNKTTLNMKELSDQFLTEYLERDKPFDCAGSYKIERGGITLFDKIECEDFTAIMGLPLMELTSHLQKLNYIKS